MMPGLIPSVIQTASTIAPISVSMRTNSPVRTPMRAASSGCIHTGFLWLISYNHLALALRVWINVGSRKFGSSSISPLSRAMLSGDTWLSNGQGITYSCSGQPHSCNVSLNSSSFLLGVLNPARRLPSSSTTPKAPYLRIHASGVSPSAAAVCGKPGTECSKIHPKYSSIVIGSPGASGLSKY